MKGDNWTSKSQLKRHTIQGDPRTRTHVNPLDNWTAYITNKNGVNVAILNRAAVNDKGNCILNDEGWQRLLNLIDEGLKRVQREPSA